MTDIKRIADEIIAGKRLTYEDNLEFLLTADLSELCSEADRIRSELCGRIGSLCTIINGRCGSCPENCRFCAQSAHHSANINEHDFLDEETIISEYRSNEAKGIRRMSIVTAGRKLDGEDFEKAVSVFSRLSHECNVGLCASFGLLTEEQYKRLFESGVRFCHCNLETSRGFFPSICTTHTYDEKIACIKAAQRSGLSVCSGGIIGMGETWEDRIDLALELSSLGIMSIPLNVLKPIKGTPLGELPRLSEDDILRTIAIFRFLNPKSFVRISAGRELLKDSGIDAFRSGANAAITGDMLTTTGSNIRSDIEMLRSLGYKV